MKKLMIMTFLALGGFCCAQTGNYSKLADQIKTFKPDTAAVPDDDLTRAIRELRKIKGINANEVAVIKIREERDKGKVTKEQADRLEKTFVSGAGAKQLENAVIRIYRQQFTLEEIEAVTAFYRTDAGKKMAANFPLVMLESMKAAETVLAARTGRK